MTAAHKPTDKTRAQVEALVAAGVDQPMIGRIIGISDRTLRKHYRNELEMGEAKMLAQVANSLFQQAVGRPAQFDARGNKTREELKPIPAAGMFIMKCRGGWSETVQIKDVTDPAAGATERLAGEINRRLAARAAAGSASGPDQKRVH